MSLLARNSIKKRLQYRCFSVKFTRFLRTTFFIGKLQWLLPRFNSCFQRSLGQKPMRLSPIHTRFSWKGYLPPRKSKSTYHRCSEWFYHVICFAKVALLLLKKSNVKIIITFRFTIKKLAHMKWGFIIPSLLRLLLKVWIWFRCQNRKFWTPWWRIISFNKKKAHIKT